MEVVHSGNESIASIGSGSIDCLIASLSLHLIESADSMLRESMKVMRKGGR